MKRSSPRPAPPLPTARHALFLDFDGTLVESPAHPEQAIIPDALCGMLAGLERRFQGALAIVTGRRLESLDERLAPLKLCGAGLHGAQLRVSAREPIEEARSLEGILPQVQALFVDEPAVRLEDKGAVIAVHCPDAESGAATVRRALVPLAAEARLEIIEGSGVFELIARGHGKDVAVRRLMRHAPFQHRLPVFIGDSASDEAGIREAQTLGGIGIKVGRGDTVAGWRLENPAAVIDWLRNALWSLPDE